MNKIKSLYEAPTTETLVVRFEGRILENSPYYFGGGGIYGQEETNDNGEY